MKKTLKELAALRRRHERAIPRLIEFKKDPSKNRKAIEQIDQIAARRGALPRKLFIPKKQQRALGLLPPVNASCQEPPLQHRHD